MPIDVINHYDEHLGSIYAWMVGDFEAASNLMADYFDCLNVRPFSSGVAVDLGCGHGIQSIPLAMRGFSVVAIDTCQELLDLLSEHSIEFTIQTILDDLLNFEQYLRSQADLIVCMGDTITHLESLDQISQLLHSVSNSLEYGGTFCVSFRDYTQSELTGANRFIPVRSDDQRIHTCFLEYKSDTVTVHDLIYDLTDTGWGFSASNYDKLRLAPHELIRMAHKYGMRLIHEKSDRGMLYLQFERYSVN